MNRRDAGTHPAMTAIVILIVVLLALGLLGAFVKGLLWLTFVAGLLLVIAIAYGVSKLRTDRT